MKELREWDNMRLRTNSITILLSTKRLAAHISVSTSTPSLLKLKRRFSLTSEVFKTAADSGLCYSEDVDVSFNKRCRESGAAAAGQAPREQEDRDQ